MGVQVWYLGLTGQHAANLVTNESLTADGKVERGA